MAIKIKNQQSGRVIVVKNQNDMFNLKNTGKTFDFDDDHTTDQSMGYDLDNYNDKEREDYINVFSFDHDSSSETSTDTPLNPERDPYFNFGDDNDAEVDTMNSEKEFDINDDSGMSDDSFDFEDEEMQGSEDDLDYSGTGSDKESNPDYQGQLRSVTGANLVYKRQTQDGTYDELWIYSIGKDMASEFAIRKAILSGTDIDPNTQESDDGSQHSKSITLGNIQFISISGLPQ